MPINPNTNTPTTLAVPERFAQAPAVCLTAGEGLPIGEVAGVLELVAEVMFVTRFVPVLPSVKKNKGIRTDFNTELRVKN